MKNEFECERKLTEQIKDYITQILVDYYYTSGVCEDIDPDTATEEEWYQFEKSIREIMIEGFLTGEFSMDELDLHFGVDEETGKKCYGNVFVRKLYDIILILEPRPINLNELLPETV